MKSSAEVMEEIIGDVDNTIVEKVASEIEWISDITGGHLIIAKIICGTVEPEVSSKLLEKLIKFGE